MTVFNRLRDTVEKRVAYEKTKYQLTAMPAGIATDLGISREDAGKIASKAVYG